MQSYSSADEELRKLVASYPKMVCIWISTNWLFPSQSQTLNCSLPGRACPCAHFYSSPSSYRNRWRCSLLCTWWSYIWVNIGGGSLLGREKVVRRRYHAPENLDFGWKTSLHRCAFRHDWSMCTCKWNNVSSCNQYWMSSWVDFVGIANLNWCGFSCTTAAGFAEHLSLTPQALLTWIGFLWHRQNVF